MESIQRCSTACKSRRLQGHRLGGFRREGQVRQGTRGRRGFQLQDDKEHTAALTQRGPYRHVRHIAHPVYCYLTALVATGTMLAANNWHALCQRLPCKADSS